MLVHLKDGRSYSRGQQWPHGVPGGVEQAGGQARARREMAGALAQQIPSRPPAALGSWAAGLPLALHSVGDAWVGFLMNFTVLCAVNVMTASVHSLQTAPLNNLIRYWNSQRTTVSIQCYHSCVMSAESFKCQFILLFSCSSNLVLLFIM